MIPDSPLRDIDKAHRHVLAETFLTYKFDHMYCIRAMCFFPSISPGCDLGATYARAVYNINGKKLLEDG